MSFKFGIIRFIRSTFKPIDPEIAEKWYNRARFAYMFVAFQTAGIAYYLVQKEKRESAAYQIQETPVEQAIRVLGLTKVKIITVGKDAPEPYFVEGKTILQNREEKKKELFEKYSV